MINYGEKVSIIIPVYNVEKYLKQCVNSVLAQTYSNLEILLIDDGSKDNSGSICDELAALDDRIKVYHKENEGLGLTRNYGIERVSGKYLIFIDSDDYIEKELVERFIEIKEKYQADTVFAGYKKVDNEGRVLFEESYEEGYFKDEAVLEKFLPRLIGSLPETRDSIFRMSCARLYSVDIIMKHNIRFPSERVIQSEDGVFQFAYLQHSQSVAVSNASPYFYRENPKSLTSIYKKNKYEEMKKVYDYFKNQCELLNLPHNTELRLAKMFFVELNCSLKQEIPSISKKGYFSCRERYKIILNDKMLRSIINKYPIKKLNMKQRLFLYMVKYKQINMLMLSYKLGR